MGIKQDIKIVGIYLKCKPYIEIIKKDIGMKLSTNVVIQLIAALVQILNIINPSITHEGAKVIIGAVVGFLTLVISVMAHFSTPNGQAIDKAGNKIETKIVSKEG